LALKKIEKWIIEEKAKKAAVDKALTISLVILTLLSILMSAIVLLTGFPSLLAVAFLAVLSLGTILVSYDMYYGRYFKMFSEEAWKEEE
jgi:Flp pilus assembly protein TadB